MYLTADVKPTADVEYLSSAIIRDALVNKFVELFGREPISQSTEQPLTITDARVPGMILESVDHDVAALLKASAVEQSSTATGSIPLIENATLLYTVLDDSPAKVSLEAVTEYKSMDSTVQDTVLTAVDEQDELNIQDGVAYVTGGLATLEIGIHVDNAGFAEEFQYRLQQAGGATISEQDKLNVFSQLYTALPGGDSIKESDVRPVLLSVVGMSGAEGANTKVPDAIKAPGPQPQSAGEG